MTTAQIIGIIIGYLLTGLALDVFYLAIGFATAKEDSGFMFLSIFIWPLVVLVAVPMFVKEHLADFFGFIEKHVRYDTVKEEKETETEKEEKETVKLEKVEFKFLSDELSETERFFYELRRLADMYHLKMEACGDWSKNLFMARFLFDDRMAMFQIPYDDILMSEYPEELARREFNFAMRKFKMGKWSNVCTTEK